MTKTKLKRIMAITIAASILTGMTGCNTSKSVTNTTDKNKPVTIKMLFMGPVDIQPMDTEIGKEIEKKTGVDLEIISVDEEKYKVMLAGGDLPDIVMAQPKYFNQLIDGGNIIPMDSLLNTNGKDVLKVMPSTIEFSKKFWSNGKNSTYFLPVNVGLDAMGFEATIGASVRWDYYKELGYPQIKNENDLLNVLKAMVDKHPTTSTGKKVYGVSAFNDWGLWAYELPMASLMGYNNLSQSGYMQSADTNDIINNYINENSPLWKTVEFYKNANKLGILDPDSLTQKYADFQAKSTDGRILYSVATWATGDFNANEAKNGKGFEVLPLDWAHQWNGAYYPCGWFDKGYAISKNSKNPEKAMDLINYLWSFEGSRLEKSGVKGVNWDIVDGKAELKDDTIKLKNSGGDAFKKTGITRFENMVGISGSTINTEDKSPVDLFNTPKAYEALMTPLSKDYSDYYGVKYPSQALSNLVKSGKAKDQSSMDVRIAAALPSSPDDIKRIDAKLDNIMTKAIPKAILAKSDEDFQNIKTQTITELKAAGADQSQAWWFKAWDDARKAVGPKTY